MTRQTVELNGNRYDAKTGNLLGAARSQHKPAAHKPARQSKPTAMDIQRQPERSKTLMRHVVKKPEPTKLSSKDLPSVVVPHASVDPKRLHHAKTIKKSHKISKFGSQQPAVPAKPAVLPVQPEPKTPPPFSPVSHLAAVQQPSHKPDFDQAIKDAQSHHQPHHKKTKNRAKAAHKLRVSPHMLNFAAASLVILAIGGFLAWQNAPRFSMSLATAQAGVNGSLPGYTPSGFGLNGPIQYTDGQVSITYKSRTDNRQFTIHQRQADTWSADSLEQDYLKQNVLSYQTLKQDGKTLHIYDGSNVTWLQNNTWYQIEGNSNLTPDQLLRLASSM